MESPDSQPCGLTVLDDPGPFHDDDGAGDSQEPLPVTASQEPVPGIAGQEPLVVSGSQEPLAVSGSQEPVPVNVVENPMKKQKVETRCRDQIKWVGTVPFVLAHETQRIHCGNSVMCRTKVGDLTVIHCLTHCCSLGGHPKGVNKCGCFCHLLAQSYQYQWPPASIEG